ncbi:MAG: tyrosine--tRNA ligase, partial [Paracoccus sp. (in: a-proteobacteria)]
MLSPYEFWQFWRNTTDADVGRFLKLYTELPVDECDRLSALQGSEINEGKIRLANEVTTLLHGAEAAASAEATAREVFEQGGAGGDLEVVTIAADALPVSVTQLLAQTGITASGKEAKRLIGEGGLRLNNDPVSDPQLPVDAGLIGDGLKVSVGKKKHRMVQIG